VFVVIDFDSVARRAPLTAALRAFRHNFVILPRQALVDPPDRRPSPVPGAHPRKHNRRVIFVGGTRRPRQSSLGRPPAVRVKSSTCFVHARRTCMRAREKKAKSRIARLRSFACGNYRRMFIVARASRAVHRYSADIIAQ